MKQVNFLGYQLNPIILFVGSNLLAGAAAWTACLAFAARLYLSIHVFIDTAGNGESKGNFIQELPAYLMGIISLFFLAVSTFTIVSALLCFSKAGHLRETFFACSLITSSTTSLFFIGLTVFCVYDQQVFPRYWQVPGLAGPTAWIFLTAAFGLVAFANVRLWPHVGRRTWVKEEEEEGEGFERGLPLAAVKVGAGNSDGVEIDLARL